MDVDAPTIAVTTGFTDYGDYLGFALSRPLLAAGAVPFLLPYLEDPAARSAALDRVDGLLLGFGRDIEPERFGGEPHPTSTAFSPARDAFELALFQEALERGLPMLGICRGMQIMNVARGGTLYPDRSAYPGGGAEHPGGDWATWALVCDATMGLGSMPEHPGHALRTRPGSRVGTLMGDEAWVNSYHHQAVCELGNGVVATAWAPDGVVEAIEMPAARAPVVGVQWELQVDSGPHPLMYSFVQDAREATGGRARARGEDVGSRPALGSRLRLGSRVAADRSPA